MSNIKKNTLAIALVAALGLAGNAAAYTFGTGPTASPGDQNPELIASADIADATTVVALSDDAYVTIAATDNIIGRTTGFGVRLSLSNGAQFVAGTPIVNLNADMVLAGWTAVIAAGDGTGTVVISITPPDGGGVGVPEGDLFTLSGIELDNLEALQTEGATINATIAFFDPVTTQPILTNQTTPLLRSGNPLDLTCSTEGLGGNSYTKRIDVGVTEDHASKTYFSGSGEIGEADAGNFRAGIVSLVVEPGFTFAYQPTDEFTTVVTGNFGAFDQAGAIAKLVPRGAACDAPALVTGVFNADATEITFDYTGATIAITPAGQDVDLCFSVPFDNEVVIDATSVSVQTTFVRGDFEYTAPGQCQLLPMLYNGSVVKVATFNPAGNTTAQSFLRITNPGSTSGLVTIDAWDDAGVYAGPVTFTLGAKQSKQINSDVIEGGGAGYTGSLGDGAGKWRFLVTGEFAGMRVQSLNRNNTDGTVTNLTSYETGEKQSKPSFFGENYGDDPTPESTQD
ncbi:MAG TPA: hypothetical protein DC063_05220 [Arenimonas sp.]|nr:MAG: hypothetical protein A2X76_04140 [Xanthomonadales bacterium GWF1_69_6]HBD19531.1 hypothetical protein [Arenimonas sp.]